MKTTLALRQLLDEQKTIVIPGCYDALTAKIVEKVGFEAAYLSGFATSGTLLGKPDFNLTTLTELSTTASHITSAVNIPVIADGEAGFGGPLNVARLVQEYEKVGLAGLHIEDQETPKKGGILAGRALVSAEEMVGKIKAALDAREDEDFLIIARTDSIDISFEEAVRRGNLYAKAGADLIFPISRSLKQLKEYPKRIDAPLVAIVNEGMPRDFTYLPVEEFERLGYKMIWFIMSEMWVAVKAIWDLWTEVKRTGTSKAFKDRIADAKDFLKLIDSEQYRQFELKYLSEEQKKKRYGKEQWGH